MKKPLALIILDGYGLAPLGKKNAITKENSENLMRLFEQNPFTQIGASGLDVGLPDGQMGNSEVGHTNIGAGRVVYQELTRISKSIDDGDFYDNDVLVNAIKAGKTIHLMGLLSDGGVHSHNTHLFALLKLCKKLGATNVLVHAFLDGRDVAPNSGKGFILELEEEINKIGVGKIATIIGRYYSMDRENKWDRVNLAYNAIAKGDGKKESDAVTAIENSYENGVYDEFVVPTVCADDVKVDDNDSIIFFNFRPDRAREITRAFVDPDFDGFCREKLLNLNYVCMTQYDKTMPNVEVAYKPQSLDMPIGEIISKQGMTQLRIAEYTKYAHVTFFLNGGVEKQYDGEDRILVDSPNVATYDLCPQMSAYEVTQKVTKEISDDKYDFIVLNYANCDMVGHTGIYDAAYDAVKAVDECVIKVVDEISKKGGISIITADHGNADIMYEDDLSPFTAHTTNPVPFCIIGAGDINLAKTGGKLADIAPTILDLLNIEKPAQMDGNSLIVK